MPPGVYPWLMPHPTLTDFGGRISLGDYILKFGVPPKSGQGGGGQPRREPAGPNKQGLPAQP